jgi:hypothetical protein
MHRDRSAAEPHGFGVEFHDISDEHRHLEFAAIERDRHKNRMWIPFVQKRFTPCGDGSRLVDVTQKYSAKDRAVGIRILRHHDDLNGGIGFGHRVLTTWWGG